MKSTRMRVSSVVTTFQSLIRTVGLLYDGLEMYGISIHPSPSLFLEHSIYGLSCNFKGVNSSKESQEKLQQASAPTAVDREEETAETETCGGLAGETAQMVGTPS